jgi:hypothetical protein
LSLVGLLVMKVRVGGQGVGWILLGVYGVAADMYLIVGGIALARGAACYEKCLPTYELFKEAMTVQAQQDAAPPGPPAASQQASR